MAKRDGACSCERLPAAFRAGSILLPCLRFRVVAKLPDLPTCIGERQVWACRRCGRNYARLAIAFKDMERFVVRPPEPDPERWDWEAIADLAATARCR